MPQTNDGDCQQSIKGWTKAANQTKTPDEPIKQRRQWPPIKHNSELGTPGYGYQPVILGGNVALVLAARSCALAWGLYWYLDARFYQSTDDAYVAGNVVAVSSRENATVMVLHADNTETVRRGQLLIEMDPTVATGQSAGGPKPIWRAPYAQVRGELLQRRHLFNAPAGSRPRCTLGPGQQRL